MHEVVLHPKAVRELDRVPPPIFARVDAAVVSLRNDPRPMGVKKLSGDLYRIRIGEWRVVFAIRDAERRVVVVRVARRSEKTYRNLPSL